MKTKIVLVITDRQSNAAIKAAKPDMVELRIDLLKRHDVNSILKVCQQRRELNIPLILTVRNQIREGAKKEFSDAIKAAWIMAALPFADYIDIELSSPILKPTIDLARQLKKKVIVSMHDFKGMPKDLKVIVKQIFKAKADYAKIAVTPKNMDDVLSLAQMQSVFGDKLALMALGPSGKLSRLILPAAGSALVYTVLDKPVVVGQMDIKALRQAQSFFYP